VKAGLELEMPAPGAVVLLEDLGTEDVAGHQVGRELHAPELQVERLSKRAHQQGLAEPGYAFEQAVPTGQQADQQLFDHGLLPDDGLGDRGAQRADLRQPGLDAGFADVGRAE